MDNFTKQLRLAIADRHAPEAAAFYQTLLKYIHKRIHHTARRCGRGLPVSEIDELVADVAVQLMSGGLARFQGGSLPELLGFVRTICDRTTWRAARRHERERLTLAESGHELVAAWSSRIDAPDKIELEPDSPLSSDDQRYLQDLLRCGTKAELSRRAGVSRAAVTQRVQRIRRRIDALRPGDRMAHDAWMQREATIALSEGGPIG